MFLSRYQDRPSTLRVEHETVENMFIDIEGQSVTKARKGKVHSLNEFDITVWEDGEVTAKRRYYAPSDPGKHFPNMSVADGAITLPIEDLVSFILARISAAELAEGIMADDEARAALVEKMSQRYTSPSFEDADRREFLTKVQQQVYAVAIDRAIERLNHREENARSRDDYYRWNAVQIGHYTGLYEHCIARIGDDADALKKFEDRFTSPEKLKLFLGDLRDPVVKENVGHQWHESRDYWRERLEEFFPEPVMEGGDA